MLIYFHAICAICGISIFTKEGMLVLRVLTWMVLMRMVKKTYLKMNFTIFCGIYKRVYGGIQGAHMEVAHM